MNLKRPAAILALLAIGVLGLLSSCTLTNDFSNGAKAAALEGGFLFSHLEATDLNVAYSFASRAAVPATAISTGVTLPAPAPGVVSADYPEKGQSSTYTIVAAPSIGADIYLATVTTSYGGGWVGGVRQTTTESYYFRDSGATVGTYNTDDPIVDVADPSGPASPLSRVGISTTYVTKPSKGQKSETTVRNETIVTGSAPSGYVSFAAEPLVYNWDYAPATAAVAVNWSSEVSYTQDIPAAAFSQDGLVVTSSPTFYLEGRRYYTEIPTAGTTDGVKNHEASSLAFERVYDGPITKGLSSGRLVAEIVTRVSYTRVNGVPSAASAVDSVATYKLNDSDPPLVVTKTGLGTSTPLP